jgi:N-acetylmuramoyl-L-alanine amidase
MVRSIEERAEAAEQASMAAIEAEDNRANNLETDAIAKAKAKAAKEPIRSILDKPDEEVASMSAPELQVSKTLTQPKQEAKPTAPKPKAKPTSTKASEPSNTGDYTIAKGDTLSAIAKRNNTSVAELKRINNIADVDKIQAGAKLKFRDDPKPTESPVANALKKSEPLRVSKMDLNKIEAGRSDGYASMTSYNKKGEDPRAKANRAVNEGLAMGTLIGGSAMAAPIAGAARAVKPVASAAAKTANKAKSGPLDFAMKTSSNPGKATIHKRTMKPELSKDSLSTMNKR